jgi:hypothetical protein
MFARQGAGGVRLFVEYSQAHRIQRWICARETRSEESRWGGNLCAVLI